MNSDPARFLAGQQVRSTWFGVGTVTGPHNGSFWVDFGEGVVKLCLSADLMSHDNDWLHAAVRDANADAALKAADRRAAESAAADRRAAEEVAYRSVVVAAAAA